MGKIVLVTDVDTPTGYALFRNYLDDGNKVAGTVSSLKKDTRIPDMQKEASSETSAIIEWRRISPVESRNLLLSILKKFKRLDEAVILQPRQMPELSGPDKSAENMTGQDILKRPVLLHETGIAAIEKEIDYRIKGLLYISREIIKNFIAQKSGFLLFVNNFHNTDDDSALSSLIANGVSGFLKKLMRTYSASGVSINTVESESPAGSDPAFDEEFAAFIYKSISEKLKAGTGKYLRYAPQKNFFSSLGKMIKNRT